MADNFSFLTNKFPVLAKFGALAEQYLYSDPNSCLIKLRMLGETKDILNTCMKSGTTVESINAKALMEYELPIAPLKEEKEIVDKIVKLINKENRVKFTAESVLDQIDTMKKSILARAFRGELGTNDPADEPAIEMLKRVLE